MLNKISLSMTSRLPALRTLFQKMARPVAMVGIFGAISMIPGDTVQPQSLTVFEQLTAKTCPPSSQNHSPTFVSLTGGQGRVPTALQLYLHHQDQNPLLYISGVDRDVTLADVLTANRHEDLIPEIGRSIFEDHAETTNANAIQTAMFLKGNCISNVTFITSDYHMERARFVFERALRNIQHDPNIRYVSVNAPPLSQYEQFEEMIKRRAVEFFNKLDVL